MFPKWDGKSKTDIMIHFRIVRDKQLTQNTVKFGPWDKPSCICYLNTLYLIRNKTV